jgi:hypothetical protein
MNQKGHSGNSRPKKIWIDLDNSPHVPFFKPIIDALDKRGYVVTLTARDCFQVCDLADLFNLQYKLIGRHYGKNKVLKLAGLGFRALQMAPAILSQKPDLALSHGSRSQILLASMLRIPSVLILDYEHTQWLPLIHPTWMFVPEVIPDSVLKKFPQRIYKYPGIKEDVYVPNLRPAPGFLKELGIREDELVVTIRPPANEAHYHNSESETLFAATIDFLGHVPNIRLVVLPRNEKQQASIQQQWPQWCNNKTLLIPERVLDGLSLIWNSDLVISGGGTMNREAAALGVPVYSIFRGRIGAVDKYLADLGKLIILERVEDVRAKIALTKRRRLAPSQMSKRRGLDKIVEDIATLVESR